MALSFSNVCVVAAACWMWLSNEITYQPTGRVRCCFGVVSQSWDTDELDGEDDGARASNADSSSPARSGRPRGITREDLLHASLAGLVDPSDTRPFKVRNKILPLQRNSTYRKRFGGNQV